jgi:ADP-ribosyl-[dinitrogen reductase] hydrolase
MAKSPGSPTEDGEDDAFIVDPDGERLEYKEEWEGRGGRTMSRFMDEGKIGLQVGENAFLYTTRPPMPRTVPWDRIEGMMLGLAIGDGLGKGSEGMIPEQRGATFGEVRDYPRLHDRAMGDGRGYPTDDTQLAFWTLERMIADRGFDPEKLADTFCSSQIYGIGKTMRGFVAARKERGLPWHESGRPSAGNGALMRIAPMLIPHLQSTGPDLWADVALSTMVTHNDPAAISSCIAFVNILWKLLRRDTPPSPEWWPRMFAWVAADLEGDTLYEPRGGEWKGRYKGPMWKFVADRATEAYKEGLSVLDACNSWHSAAYLMETLPSVLYILMKHGHDPEEAIVRAVNDTKDNDTIAAIVGSAVGALHGKSRLPQRWVAGLSGRTRTGDDGRAFDLLEEAHKLWWPIP